MAAAVGQGIGRGGGGGRSGGLDLLPTTQALAMAERIGSLSGRRKFGRLSRGTVEAGRQSPKPTHPRSKDNDMQRRGGEDDADVCTPTTPATTFRSKRAQRRRPHKTTKDKGDRRLKKRGRARESPSHRGGDSGSRCAKANGNNGKGKVSDSMEVSTDGEGGEEEEAEWEG